MPPPPAQPVDASPHPHAPYCCVRAGPFRAHTCLLCGRAPIPATTHQMRTQIVREGNVCQDAVMASHAINHMRNKALIKHCVLPHVHRAVWRPPDSHVPCLNCNSIASPCKPPAPLARGSKKKLGALADDAHMDLALAAFPADVSACISSPAPQARVPAATTPPLPASRPEPHPIAPFLACRNLPQHGRPSTCTLRGTHGTSPSPCSTTSWRWVRYRAVRSSAQRACPLGPPALAGCPASLCSGQAVPGKKG